MIVNINLTSITLIFFIYLSDFATKSNTIDTSSNLEKNLLFIEQISKISQIKSIENEIRANLKARTIEAATAKEDIKNNGNPNKQAKQIKFSTDVTVNGDVSAHNIDTNELKVKDSTTIQKELKVNKIITNELTATTIITDTISSPTGVLTIEGDVLINNDVLNDSVNIRGSSFFVEGKLLLLNQIRHQAMGTR